MAHGEERLLGVALFEPIQREIADQVRAEPGGSTAARGRGVIFIALWTERDGRSSGPPDGPSNTPATTCRQPGPSFTVCWMNNSADSTPAWKVWLGAMAENNGW